MSSSSYASSDLTGTRIKRILLTRPYRELFFPSLIAAVALSLSECVDSIIVSNLLDEQALSIVNVCMPLMTMMAAVYLLFAVGGVICYTERRGRSDAAGAASIFTACLAMSLLMGVLFVACGLLFTRTIGNLLCPGLILGEDLLTYIRILSHASPVVIVVSVVLYFLTAAGNPRLSMALNIFANVLNLLLDYVFIRLCGMGVSGAAMATLTSFASAGVVLLLLRRQYDLRLVRISLADLSCLPAILRGGLAIMLSQISFSIKFAYCNATAASLGGNGGIVAMSLIVQTVSIISIVLCGASDTIRPFLTLLRTQHDYSGTEYILKRTLWIVGASSVAFALLLELSPGTIAAIYNVTDPDALSVALPALRIMGITFLFRSVCMVYMTYVTILGMVAYSSYISLFDGFVGIVGIGMVLSHLFGLTGLWLTYPVDAFLLFCSIVLINMWLCKRYPERFANVLLIEKNAPDVRTLDLAIDDDDQSIAFISERAAEFCEQNGLSRSFSQKVGLITEEMAVYIRGHIQSQELLNLLLQKKGNSFRLNFRSIGEQYDLSTCGEADIAENYQLLTALVQDYTYNYTIGMNNLRVSFRMVDEES